MGLIARRWTLIGVRNPSDSGTHVCVTVDEPPLDAGERVEVVPAADLEGVVEALERARPVLLHASKGGLPRMEAREALRAVDAVLHPRGQ